MEQTNEMLLFPGRDDAPAAVEEWRPIPGAEGLYSVSNLGHVRSEPIQTSRVGKQRGRILRCYRDSKGYLQFGVSLPDGRHKRMKVHRAVALAFLGPRPEGYQINHKSGDKQDNSVGNLEYVTCQQNIRHGWQTGLYRGDHARGERNTCAKLTADDVRRIRELRQTMSLAELARQFGVTPQAIWHVVNGKTWKHVA
jgi:hypothetical protein